VLACGGDDRPAPPAAAPGVVAPTRSAPSPDAPARWIGVIAAAEAVDLAPRFDGVLAAVRVRPGDVVAAGDIVATLDPRAARDELTAARAAAREARARLRRARVEVERARHKLATDEAGLEAGATARATVEDARLTVRAAEAAASESSAAAAEADTRVDRADARLAETELRAPFAGSIGARYRDPGAAVGPNVPVARVIGGGGLRLRFAVTPDEAGRLAAGARVMATLEGGREVAATVEHVAPSIDQPSQRVFVEAALTADAAVTPGQAAVVQLGGGE
jgi:HlyD family secretion protein